MSEVLHLILRMMLEQWKTMDEELIVYRLKQTAEMAEELERERDEARRLVAVAQEAFNVIHVEVGGWISATIEGGDR